MTGPKHLSCQTSPADPAGSLAGNAHCAPPEVELSLPCPQDVIDRLRRANEAALSLIRLIDEIGTTLNQSSVRASERMRGPRQVLYGPVL